MVGVMFVRIVYPLIWSAPLALFAVYMAGISVMSIERDD